VEGNVVEIPPTPPTEMKDDGDDEKKRSPGGQGSKLRADEQNITTESTCTGVVMNKENQPSSSSLEPQTSSTSETRNRPSVPSGQSSSFLPADPYSKFKATAASSSNVNSPSKSRENSPSLTIRTHHSAHETSTGFPTTVTGSQSKIHSDRNQLVHRNSNISGARVSDKDINWTLSGQKEQYTGFGRLNIQPNHPCSFQQQHVQKHLDQQQNQQDVAPIFATKRAQNGLQYGRGRRLSLIVEQFCEGPVPVNKEAASEWIYPVNKNFPRRDYQFEIAQTAIEYNTLVSLPTGLGKTHIAAVVMYNFWRWFAPEGKVVFCAPTVPLVRQQVEACYSITGIPASDTCVMTGKSMKPQDRRQTWEQKRVFYCTPQTIQKDLEAAIKEAEETGETGRSNFASQIVCLVLDEAHRATGKYAYVRVIELLESIGAKFRIVGLSATPGTSIKAVQGVLEVLRTTKVQVRTEEDESVSRYLHEKQEEVVICPKSNVQGNVERQLTDLLCPILNRLRERGVFRKDGNATVTGFLIHQEREWYTTRVKQGQVSGFAYPLFSIAQKLANTRSSVRQSLQMVLKNLLEIRASTLAEYKRVATSPEFQSLFDSVSQSASDDNQTDPKLIKLKEELFFHFEKKNAIGESSKAIVFVNSRDAVQAIVEYLRKFQPLIIPRHFIGQSSGAKKSDSNTNDDKGPTSRLDGMAQKEQEKVIRQFKEGIYNVLVCTSIGEEGLDIGEVE
jgi:ERCC4-related helicase